MRHLFIASVVIVASSVSASADIRTWGFDDGTLQGWAYVNVDNEPYPVGNLDETGVAWSISEIEIDLGENNWNLLQGSTVNGIGTEDAPQRVPNYRVIPDPWDNRDCLGGLQCQTQIFKSPTFQLDDSGPISVDIMGGQAQGGRAFDPATDTPPEFPEDHDFLKTSNGWQGFALYDVAEDEYVRWGFPSFNNDGKERDGRGVWETVTIPAEDLAELANDGKQYRLDVFDSHAGGWGWIGFDTVRIPERRITAEWDGGDGPWVSENWNGGQSPDDVLGRSSGSDGAKNLNGGETIVIGGGANVSYDGNANGDFRIKQGSELIIKEGATWIQATDASYSENRWTQMDLSKLSLDGGHFKRSGAASLGGGPEDPEGGGALIFGSWRGDDNFDSGRTPFPQQIEVEITNGGSLENEGQLWLGGWEDHPAGLEVTVTINDGSIGLTGGDVPGTGDEADADLVFTFGLDTEGKFTENAGDPKNEQYVVNFTGPGSITVDSSGIIAPVQAEMAGGGFEWTNLQPIGYEALWNMGILQAGGVSGLDGATFSDFFSVTNSVGMDDYMLTSLVGQMQDCIAGDVTCNGVVDFLDFIELANNFGQMGSREQGDLDGNGTVEFLDFIELANNFGMTAAATTEEIPEPSTGLLGVAGFLALLGLRVKRK